jgi:hypothetical protein
MLLVIIMTMDQVMIAGEIHSWSFIDQHVASLIFIWKNPFAIQKMP